MTPFTPPEPQYPVPEIKLPEDAPYYVELGYQRFTQHQWELIQLYAQGFHRAQQHDEYEAGHAEGFHMGRSTPEKGHKAQRQNREFHDVMGIATAASPQAIPAEDVPVVIELIREEFIDELIPALGFKATFTHEGKLDTLERVAEPNVQEIYDAFIDILYVTYGGLNRAGMDAEPGYDEVQGSNMSKLGEDGKPIIAGENDPDGIFPGRVKKGPNYYKPNLARVLAEQGWQG